MDKKTLSHYGWTIVVTIILSILITAATPFGNTISNSVTEAVSELSANLFLRIPVSYKNVVQEGGWEYIQTGEIATESASIPDSDKSEDGLATAITLTRYSGESEKTITIPNIYKDPGSGKTMVVVAVGNELAEDETFNENNPNVFGDESDKISTVIVSDGIEINTGAFHSMENLKSVIIADNNSLIGPFAFYNCLNLKNVRCGEANENIGAYAFAGCSSLSNIKFSDTLYGIDDFAFANCSLLSLSEGLPKSLTNIGNNSFAGCLSLTNFDLSEGQLLSIGDYAFEGCSNLKNVVLSPTTRIIGSYLFKDCPNLSNTFKLPSDVEVIKDYAFASSSFSELDTSEALRLKYIGNHAFENCPIRGSLVLPSSVEYVGSYAFANCFNITHLTFGEGIRILGSYAFSGLTNLKSSIVLIPSTCVSLGGSVSFDEANNNFAYTPINDGTSFYGSAIDEIIYIDGEM